MSRPAAISGNPIPSAYKGAIPYLNVLGGWDAIEFYKQAFGAEQVVSIERAGGLLAHAELRIAEAVIMIREEYPEHGFLSPSTVGGTGCEILVYVEDVWSLFDQAVVAGAEVIRPVERQFHGDDMAILKDPYGHVWFFATRIEEMSVERLRKSAAEAHI